MIIGIDLGTTNSLAACFKDGRAVIIPNRLKKNLTPSVVAVDDKAQILVGETAREYGLLHPEHTAEVFKRFMGSERQYDLGGHKFRAEELSAMVLKSLKEDAESFLGETVKEAVISVPAYFDDKRRKATKLAGELAGFKVERIISEPTAAAITYGLYEKTESTRFLVFDLGGGTFDVSILELFGTILEVRAVAGDNYLGGENFTRVLEQEFLRQNGLDEEALDQKTLSAIHEAAESCKKQFGSKDPAEMCCRVGEDKMRLTLSAKEYEALCQPLLKRIEKPLKQSISDAHVRLSEIDEVVLVGGATRMPVIRDFVVKLFHKFPDVSIHPDEAVAPGSRHPGSHESQRQGSERNHPDGRVRVYTGDGGVGGAEKRRLRGGAFLSHHREKHGNSRQPHGALLHDSRQPGHDPDQRVPGGKPSDSQQPVAGKPGDSGAEEQGRRGGGGCDVHLRHQLDPGGGGKGSLHPNGEKTDY